MHKSKMLTVNPNLYLLWGLTKWKWRHISSVQEQVGTHTRTVGDIQPGSRFFTACLYCNKCGSI